MKLNTAINPTAVPETIYDQIAAETRLGLVHEDEWDDELREIVLSAPSNLIFEDEIGHPDDARDPERLTVVLRSRETGRVKLGNPRDMVTASGVEADDEVYDAFKATCEVLGTTMDDLIRQSAEVAGEDMAIQCVCGTEIPRKGVDFEPQCRHCERVRVSRLSIE